MSKYQAYFKYISRNRDRYDHFLAEIEQLGDEQERLSKAQDALTYLVKNSSAIYASSALEQVFLDVAERLDDNGSNPTYVPSSFLHVISEAYTFGGHTRVVERWISQAPTWEKHSVVLLRQNRREKNKIVQTSIPQSLVDSLARKNGKLLNLSGFDDLNSRALMLRKIAMEYEYIILHIHMDDPTALVAFGTTKFTRPVIFFNHADHAFWCGVSIADMVADLNQCGQKRSIEKRGIARSSILGIPLDDHFPIFKDKNAARQKLGLPENKKLIFMSGSRRKFSSLGKNEFIKGLSNILTRLPHCSIYMVGPHRHDSGWNELAAQFTDRIRFRDPIGYHDGYIDYVCSADLIIDSYPVNGGTALIDASLAGKPVLSLKCDLGQSDYIVHSTAYCENIKELEDKAENILNNNDYAKTVAIEIQQKMLEEHSPQNWEKRKQCMLSATPDRHAIYKIAKSVERPDICDEDVLVALWHGGPNFYRTGLWKYFHRIGKSIRKRLSGFKG